jgi:Family of unknown function (DUF6510)
VIELDGNALAGDLFELCGIEMSAATSVCASCGTPAAVAEAVVYMRGPGRVARCPSCGALQMVLVTIRDVTCVDLMGIAEIEMESLWPSRTATTRQGRPRARSRGCPHRGKRSGSTISLATCSNRASSPE